MRSLRYKMKRGGPMAEWRRDFMGPGKPYGIFWVVMQLWSIAIEPSRPQLTCMSIWTFQWLGDIIYWTFVIVWLFPLILEGRTLLLIFNCCSYAAVSFIIIFYVLSFCSARNLCISPCFSLLKPFNSSRSLVAGPSQGLGFWRCLFSVEVFDLCTGCRRS